MQKGYLKSRIIVETRRLELIPTSLSAGLEQTVSSAACRLKTGLQVPNSSHHFHSHRIISPPCEKKPVKNGAKREQSELTFGNTQPSNSVLDCATKLKTSPAAPWKSVQSQAGDDIYIFISCQHFQNKSPTHGIVEPIRAKFDN